MSRWVRSFSSRYRAGTVVLALMAALLLVVPASAVACGDEGTEDTAPLINWAKVAPASLPYEGGTAAVSTEVEDDCGVQQVYAEIITSEGTFASFQLLPWENINGKAIVYHGEFQVPPNYREWSVDYGVEISVLDTNGAPATRLAGEVQVDAAPQFDEAPYVSEASLTPSIVGSGGGGVKIAATATDDRSISYVFGIVTYPDETQHEVPLEGISSSRFQGRFIAPANNGVAFEQYSVNVYAEDDIGQRRFESAGTFKVAPRTGKLNAWTSAGSYFGPVQVGERAVRTIVVRNSGGPKTAPVTASITTSGGPFALKDAEAGKIEFTLGPGEMRVFEVEFLPTSPGFKAGSAIVSRADGAQPDIAVTLTGQGVKPPST
jgi:hypothetical protein